MRKFTLPALVVLAFVLIAHFASDAIEGLRDRLLAGAEQLNTAAVDLEDAIARVRQAADVAAVDLTPAPPGAEEAPRG